MEKHEFDDFIKGYRETQGHYFRITGESGEFFARYKAEKIAEWFSHLRGKSISILDYGCGDGLMTAYIRKYFPKAIVHGNDPSSKSIDYAKRHFKNIKFSVLSRRMIYKNESMDIICAAGVFHHIHFNQHKKFLSDIFRVLKHRGIFVMFELNPLNPATVIIFKRSPVDKNAQMLPSGYAKNMLKEYSIPEIKYISFFPSFLKKMRVCESRMTKIPFGGLYAAIAKKRP